MDIIRRASVYFEQFKTDVLHTRSFECHGTDFGTSETSKVFQSRCTSRGSSKV